MQSTPFLPGESHEQRSLEGCSPRGHKESDMTEHTCTQALQLGATVDKNHSAGEGEQSVTLRNGSSCALLNERRMSLLSRHITLRSSLNLLKITCIFLSQFPRIFVTRCQEKKLPKYREVEIFKGL